MSLGLIAEDAAARHPNIPIWLDAPLDIKPQAGTLTDFQTFAGLVKTASAWIHMQGARRGDIVAISKTNRLDVLALAFGAARIGAIPALLSPAIEPSVLNILLERLGRPLLVTDAITIDDDDPIPEPSPRTGKEGALITHTSGTTGVPKLALFSADAVEATTNAQMRIARWLRVKGPVAACVTAYHARTVTGLIALLNLGVPFVSIADPDPNKARDLLLKTRPDMLEAHPNILILWEQLADDPARPLRSVRVFSSTFDAAHPRTIKKLLDASASRFPIYAQGLAQTEVGPVTLHPQTRHLRWHGGRCVGWAWPGFDRVRVDRAGRIQVQSKGRCIGLVGQDEETAARDHHGWWDMGDTGFKTRWGCLHMLDRTAEVIEGFGSALAVEDALLERLPQLTEVVVVKVDSGPPVPFYATRDGAPLDFAKATVGLPAMGRPVHLAWDRFPRTGTWKVRRKELQAVAV